MCSGRSSPWARQSQMYHNRKNILGRLGNYVALIRAPGCKTSIDGTRSQRAGIKHPIAITFWAIGEFLSSGKSSRSQNVY